MADHARRMACQVGMECHTRAKATHVLATPRRCASHAHSGAERSKTEHAGRPISCKTSDSSSANESSPRIHSPTLAAPASDTELMSYKVRLLENLSRKRSAELSGMMTLARYLHPRAGFARWRSIWVARRICRCGSQQQQRAVRYPVSGGRHLQGGQQCAAAQGDTTACMRHKQRVIGATACMGCC